MRTFAIIAVSLFVILQGHAVQAAVCGPADSCPFVTEYSCCCQPENICRISGGVRSEGATPLAKRIAPEKQSTYEIARCPEQSLCVKSGVQEKQSSPRDSVIVRQLYPPNAPPK